MGWLSPDPFLLYVLYQRKPVLYPLRACLLQALRTALINRALVASPTEQMAYLKGARVVIRWLVAPRGDYRTSKYLG